VFKHIKEFESQEIRKASAFLKTVDPNAWMIVDFAEDVISFFECPTKADAEELLYDFHTEGSHTDHNTYEVWHNRRQFQYKITTSIF